MIKAEKTCTSCGLITSEGKPICDECLGFYQQLRGSQPCNLCEANFARNDKGEHLSPGGGYAGQCYEFEKPEEVEDQYG